MKLKINKMKNGFTHSLTNYKRFFTHVVDIGTVPLGGHYPIRIQSMTDTDTRDVEKTTEQIIKILERGADFVRISVPTLLDVEAGEDIRRKMHERGVGDKPLVADVHFNVKVAFKSLEYFEKIRINPGNFVDKKFKNIEITDQIYNEQLQKIDKILKEFFQKAKKNERAIRIGTNYGSLSDRIIYRYGNTVEGLVQATMEYLEIANKYNFDDVVISIKASNPSVMVYANRLLVERMYEKNMTYPIHLGVTEAGNGIEGRIKSAVGIGALLVDGIGDTIRVSLTEPPEKEIPVCWHIVNYIEQNYINAPALEEIDNFFPYYSTPKDINKFPYLVITNHFETDAEQIPDFFYTENIEQITADNSWIVPFVLWQNIKGKKHNVFPLVNVKEFVENIFKKKVFLKLKYEDLNDKLLQKVSKTKDIVLVLDVQKPNIVGKARLFISKLIKINKPKLLYLENFSDDIEKFAIETSIDTGVLFIDGLINGLFAINKAKISTELISNVLFDILQSTGRRITKPEYISCPGCARTLFDLQTVTNKVKEATKHLKGCKIAVMGCIVNGPGEMLDADFGYVGASPGKITLYKGQKPIKTVREQEAIEQLVKLIKDSGKWTEK